MKLTILFCIVLLNASLALAHNHEKKKAQTTEAPSQVVSSDSHDKEHAHVKQGEGDHPHDDAHHKDHDHKAHHPDHEDKKKK